MRKWSVLLSTVVFLCTLSYAAFYVKGNHHFDSYYSYGVIHPASDRVDEWWFAEGKVGFITPDWHLILDKQEQRIIAVNRLEKTYTVIPLPVTVSSHLDPPIIEVLKDYRLDATIKTLEKKETLKGKTCEGYEISEWFIYQKNRFYERDRVVKITRDVPFDWRLLEELHQWIRSYFNPGGSYLAGLKKLQGFVLASEDVQISSGLKVKWNFSVLEISNKQAPREIFTVPGDYKKKETLSRDDLIGIRGTLYVYP